MGNGPANKECLVITTKSSLDRLQTGKMFSFEYNGKKRKGPVHYIGSAYVTLIVNEKGVRYKNFSLNSITNLKEIG